VIEIYDPLTNTFAVAGDLITDRGRHRAAAVVAGAGDRLAVLAGHGSGSLARQTIELVDPAAGTFVITTTSLPDGSTTQEYDARIFTNGDPLGNYLFTVATGSLPPGISFSVATGELVGTPNSAGTFSFTIEAALGQQVARRSFTITVNRLVIDGNDVLPYGLMGNNYTYQFTASGGSGGLTWQAFSLPVGFTLSESGLLTGFAPESPGFVFFSVKARDAAGQTAFKSVNIEFVFPMSIDEPAQVTGIVNEDYQFSIAPQNAWGFVDWQANPSPVWPGLQFHNTGFFANVTGQPRRTGVLNFVATATDQRDPPQEVSRQVTQRILAKDQNSLGGPWADILPIVNDRSLAQTLTARANAPIYAVRAAVDCTAGPLTVSIHDVELDGRPGSTVLDTVTFPTPPVNRIFPLSGSAFVTSGTRVAVVFASTGSCEMRSPSVFEVYPDGGAYENTGAGWVFLTAYPDLEVVTLVDVPTLDFTWTFRSEPKAAMAGSRIVITDGYYEPTVFDAATRTMTDHGPILQLRGDGTATALADGRVLLAGGSDGFATLNSAQLYDPVANTTTPVGNMVRARRGHTATRLPDGKVLIAGGWFNATTLVREAEIFDPATFQFTSAGDMVTARKQHQATLLANGAVLITGGSSDGQTTYFDAELYAGGLFLAANDSMTLRRINHRAVALPDGRALITGGDWLDGSQTLTSVDLYDPACDCFEEISELATARSRHTATLLADGRVLIAGGVTAPAHDFSESSFEVLDPAAAFVSHHAGHMSVARAGHQAFRLCPEGGCAYAGRVVFVGGIGGGGGAWIASNSVETIDPAGDILPVAVDGQAYSTTAGPLGFTPTDRHIVAGDIPPGLTLNAATGALSGTPTAPGSYQFTVKSSAGHLASYQSFALEVITAPPLQAGDVLISEVRTQNGPVDFVEIYNNTDVDITVSSPGSSGWALVEQGYGQLVYIPNGTVIKARGNYVASQWYGAAGPGLGISSEPMLYAGLAPSNRPIGTQGYGYHDGHRLHADIGVALFNTTDGDLWNAGHVLDAVGYTTSSALFREGGGLPATGTISPDHAWVRRQRGFAMQDTGENQLDFVLASVTADVYGLVQSMLGSSGAEHSNAPRYANQPGFQGVYIELLDQAVGTDDGVNMLRDFDDTGANHDLGTLQLRRTIVNRTGQTITRLRLRVVDITTTPRDDGDADLRVLDAANIGLTLSDGTMVSVIGATLDQPPAQALGGGRNSSLSIQLPPGGLLPGARLHVAFKLGVVQPGNYRFVLDVALPGHRGFVHEP
jgi:hypothetical protein